MDGRTTRVNSDHYRPGLWSALWINSTFPIFLWAIMACYSIISVPATRAENSRNHIIRSISIPAQSVVS